MLLEGFLANGECPNLLVCHIIGNTLPLDQHKFLILNCLHLCINIVISLFVVVLIKSRFWYRFFFLLHTINQFLSSAAGATVML